MLWENIKFRLENVDNIYIKLKKFFRDHTLEATKENIINNTTSDKICSTSNSYKPGNKNLGAYLAGLIEGDGFIYIPENNSNASIVIIFNTKDLPLALMIQKVLTVGNIYKVKGKNAYTYVISNIKGLIKIVNLINGHMRTPKIVEFYKLIDIINNKNHNLSKLPLDSSSLDTNAWLSGFIEADGCFYVRFTQNKLSNTKKIAIMLELAQKTTNLNNSDLKEIMYKISDFLLTRLLPRTKHNQYRIRTTSMEANLKLREYIEKYPLFSSKHLDFIAWKKILSLIYEKKHLNNLDIIKKYKKSMNSKRTYFKWNHLNNFYTLDS